MAIPGSEIRGLFPLGLVLMPGERVPLHIFEPRYRRLVADCVLRRSEFVLPLATDEGVAEMACGARVESLLRRFSDGRMNIVVVGTRRMRILGASDDEMYLTATVEEVADEVQDIDRNLERRVTDRFDHLITEVAHTHLDLESDHVARSYAIAGHMRLEPALKQTLLEERSENIRLAVVDEILTQAIAQTTRNDSSPFPHPTPESE